MLSIGQMAQLCQTSVQTLRLYDKEGLIKAAYIDPHTHYRYYRTDQIFLFNLIKYLQSTNLSLKEIKGTLQNDIVGLTTFWNQQEKVIQEQIKQEQQKLELAKFQRRQLDAIEIMKDHLGKGPYVKKINKKIAIIPAKEKITPKSLPDKEVAELDQLLMKAGQTPNLEYGFSFKATPYQTLEDICYQNIFKELIFPAEKKTGLEIKDVSGKYLCINFMWSTEEYLSNLEKLLSYPTDSEFIYEESYPLNYLTTELVEGKNYIAELRILLGNELS